MTEADVREALSGLNEVQVLTSLKTGQTRPAPKPTFIDVVLQHGRMYDLRPRPKGLRRGAPKACFHNAFRAVIRDRDSRFRYAEGFALFSDSNLPIHHGWLVDDAGAYEVTLATPADAYFGVECDALKLIAPGGITSAFGFSDNWLNDSLHAEALKRFEAAILGTGKRITSPYARTSRGGAAQHRTRARSRR